MKCEFCQYDWQPRKPNPLSCPRCKRRFDYPAVESSVDILADAKKQERGFQRMLFVMSIITPRLEKIGVKAVVVGGSAVEFYTRDWYATGDIDLAITKEKRDAVKDILTDLGFKNSGRMWVREDLNLYLEMPGDVRDVNTDKVLRVDTESGYAYIIGLEDIILDRLQAAEHWKSESDKEQALRIASMFFDEIDWKYLEKRSRETDTVKILAIVMEAAKNAGN